MNNRSCIFARQSNGDQIMLFEGKYQLPFFWLMLFNKEDIESYREKIAKMSEKDANPKDTTMVLDKLKAISRAAARRDYIKKHIITCLPLFDDWLYYLQIADFWEMNIYVDLYHIGSSYKNINDFCDSMLKAVVCFDEDIEAWNEETIVATCGYESRDNNKKLFSDFSKAYRELNNKNIYGRFDNKLHLNKKISYRKKIWIFAIVSLIMTALAVWALKFVV